MAEIDLGRVVGDGVLPPDTEMQSTSTNTVQNKVIKKYVDDKAYMHDLAIKMFDDKITNLETKVGDAELNTTAQDLSGAINEHEQNIIDHETKIGAAALTTTAKNLSGAVNELNTNQSTVTTVINNSEVACYRCGKIVNLMVKNKARTLNNGAVIASGLPRPYAQIIIVSYLASGKTPTFQINTDGNLNMGDTISSLWCGGFATYITQD